MLKLMAVIGYSSDILYDIAIRDKKLEIQDLVNSFFSQIDQFLNVELEIMKSCQTQFNSSNK
jgi:hypothetical protein